MDLRESIVNIITNKEEISEAFDEMLTKHFNEKQFDLREEDAENLPEDLPMNDIELDMEAEGFDGLPGDDLSIDSGSEEILEADKEDSKE